MKEILANLNRATENAIALIHEALKLMEGPLPPCRCREALKLAIWSDKTRIDTAVRQRLDPLIGRYMTDDKNSTP